MYSDIIPADPQVITNVDSLSEAFEHELSSNLEKVSLSPPPTISLSPSLPSAVPAPSYLSFARSLARSLSVSLHVNVYISLNLSRISFSVCVHVHACVRVSVCVCACAFVCACACACACARASARAWACV